MSTRERPRESAMTKPLFRIGAGVALAWLSCAPAFAGSVSYVSTRGTDAGTCALLATPCRTFAYALGQTSAQGEIFALTPGDYGPVTINKSISLTGTVAGVGIKDSLGLPAAQITISAGVNDVVYLSGLTLDGTLSSADRGVNIVSGAGVIIRKSTITNYPSFTSRGVSASAGVNRVLIEDVVLSNAQSNIFISETLALIHRVASINAAKSGAAAIMLSNAPGAMIARSSVSGSALGIGNSGVFLSRSSVSGNVVGIGSGTSSGDNVISGNGTDVLGTLTNVGRQ
jgi:hypothetical protein